MRSASIASADSKTNNRSAPICDSARFTACLRQCLALGSPCLSKPEGSDNAYGDGHKEPSGSFPGIRSFATTPTTNPNKIHPNMLMVYPLYLIP